MNMLKLEIEDIKRRYHEYNRDYFYGKLGKCEFHFFTKNIRYAGAYNRKMRSNGTVINQIWLGRCVKWTEESLKSVLIHEMIHMYTRTVEGVELSGLLGHGRAFQKHCKRLKRVHGIIIHRHSGYEIIDKRKSPAWWETLLLWIFDR